MYRDTSFIRIIGIKKRTILAPSFSKSLNRLYHFHSELGSRNMNVEREKGCKLRKILWNYEWLNKHKRDDY